MTRAQRRRLVGMVTAGCLAWLLGMSVLMWSTLPEVENHASSTLKDRMAAECQGSFAERYKCKEAIIVESGRESFWTVSARFLLVILPPLFASGWLSTYLRRNPVHPVIRHAHAEDDWKSRAQAHVQIAEDHEVPAPPADDWKSKAQEHVRTRRE